MCKTISKKKYQRYRTNSSIKSTASQQVLKNHIYDLDVFLSSWCESVKEKPELCGPAWLYFFGCSYAMR